MGPHDGKVPVNSVVYSWLDCVELAFCKDKLQSIADIYEQLLPTGQHIADFPPLKGWQVVPPVGRLDEGQQKFAGSPWPHVV